MKVMYVGISRQFTQQHVRISRKESLLLMHENCQPLASKSLSACLIQPQRLLVRWVSAGDVPLWGELIILPRFLVVE